MEAEDVWQPGSDDEYDSDRPTMLRQNDKVQFEETSDDASTGISAKSSAFHNQYDSWQKLLTVVHSVKYSSLLTSRYKVRDFAEIDSSQLARGNHLQTRKLAGDRGLAKLPVVYSSQGAVGRIEVSRNSFEAAALEIQILLHAPIRQHRNIVNIQTIGWTRLLLHDLPCLPVTFVEYASHGTLAQYLDNNTVDSAVKNSISLDIARGLQVLHSCGITHGDLKTGNVLIFPCSDRTYPVQAKLSDFGSCVLEDESGTKLRGCTPPWNAPEWYKNFAPSLLHKTDIYSLGLLIWCLTLNGRNPFEAWDSDQIETRKLSGSILKDAIQSIEQQYDTRMLLRRSLDDHSRFFSYFYSVAVPRRVFRNTLTIDLSKRSLEKVLNSLSQEYYYG
jgi:serine/threonine protein kinase